MARDLRVLEGILSVRAVGSVVRALRSHREVLVRIRTPTALSRVATPEIDDDDDPWVRPHDARALVASARVRRLRSRQDLARGGAEARPHETLAASRWSFFACAHAPCASATTAIGTRSAAEALVAEIGHTALGVMHAATRPRACQHPRRTITQPTMGCAGTPPSHARSGRHRPGTYFSTWRAEHASESARRSRRVAGVASERRHRSDPRHDPA